MQFYVLHLLPVIGGYYRFYSAMHFSAKRGLAIAGLSCSSYYHFFHCSGKNTFCRDKNPTLSTTIIGQLMMDSHVHRSMNVLTLACLGRSGKGA